MWFKKKEVPAKKCPSLDELIADRGSYSLRTECRVCGEWHKQVIPKHCLPSDLLFFPYLGWRHTGNFYIKDTINDNKYVMDECGKCGNTKRKILS